jgi:hypothetical protein
MVKGAGHPTGAMRPLDRATDRRIREKMKTEPTDLGVEGTVHQIMLDKQTATRSSEETTGQAGVRLPSEAARSSGATTGPVRVRLPSKAARSSGATTDLDRQHNPVVYICHPGHGLWRSLVRAPDCDHCEPCLGRFRVCCPEGLDR